MVAGTESDIVQQRDLADVVQEVPHLINVLHCKSRSALSGCNTHFRHIFHSWTTVVLINNQSDLQTLVKGCWPQLAAVVLRKQYFDTSWIQCDTDTLQLVAVLDLWQTEYCASLGLQLPCGNAKCSVLLVASNMQQQQAGLVYHSSSATTASAYLTARCTYVDRLALRQKNGMHGIAQLALINWCSLKNLDLRNNNFGPEGIEALVSACLPHLNNLMLHQTQLDAAAAKHLAKGDWPNLVYLGLL